MLHRLGSFLLCLVPSLVGLVPSAHAAPFTNGDVVVYRVGSGGTDALVNTGSPVYLDEYGPGGGLIQSIAMPTTASGPNKPLIASGTAASEGLLTCSADGRYLLLTGYGTTTGGTVSLASTGSAVVNRVVGRVDSSGAIDTTTALTDFADINNPRSATSTNGTDLWVSGASGGVRYTTLGSTTSTQLSMGASNVRQVEIYGGQLYASTSSASRYVLTVGSGTPEVPGQSLTALSPLTGLTSPDAFVLLDMDGTPGLDTLYVADDAGGIFKFCLVDGAWKAEGSKGNGNNTYRGLTAAVDGPDVTLYTTRKGGSGATGGGELVSLVDSSGFDGSITLSGSFVLLATADTNESFRGVAMAPSPEPCSLALLMAGGAAVLARRRGKQAKDRWVG
jgi:hypothetical protein